MKRRKKNKFRVFIFLIFLIFLSVYGGLKGGEYLANKLTKPMGDNKGIFDEIKNSTKTSQGLLLSENDKVTIAAVITEFTFAEHLKKDDKLVTMVDKSYYSTYANSLKKLSPGEVRIQEINYIDISKDRVKIEAVYIKGSKKESENITVKKTDGVWKIIEVVR